MRDIFIEFDTGEPNPQRIVYFISAFIQRRKIGND